MPHQLSDEGPLGSKIPGTFFWARVAASRSFVNTHAQVKFIGEEGVDEGGVQKEFFQLLVGAVLPATGGCSLGA